MASAIRGAKVRAGIAKSTLLCTLLRTQTADLNPKAEFRFHLTRRWRFDVAYPDYRVAVEIQGGNFVGGGHVRGEALKDEYTKLAEAAILGWRVIPVLPEWVESGVAEKWIRRLAVQHPGGLRIFDDQR